jgi:general secretion pathway protein I
MNAPQHIVESRREGGFTLVEVLVAFVVAALVLGAIYTAFSQGLRTSMATQHARDASLLAQSSVDAETNVPLRSKRVEDRIGSFERAILISARPDLVPIGAQLSVMPYEIDVQIAWRDGLVPHRIELTTLWLGPR